MPLAAESTTLEEDSVKSRPPVPRQDDPAADGWLSETFVRRAGRQLARVKKYLEHPDSADAALLLEGISAASFESSRLRPERLRTDYDDGSIVAKTALLSDAGQSAVTASDLQSELDGLLEALDGSRNHQAKFKDVGVDFSGDHPVTSHLLSVSGSLDDGTAELHAAWTVTWQRIPGENPLILAITVDSYEESRITAGTRSTLFSECTRSVLAETESFEAQILRGPAHWLTRIEAAMGTDIMGHSGLAIGDADGDGLEDLYVPQQGGLPNRLYIQNPDGSVTDRSAAARVDWLDRSLSALFIDLDNDGDQDLVVGSTIGLLMHENDGTGRFELRSILDEARYAYSLAAADYDADGDLDLYATRYSPVRDDPVDESVDVPKPIPYHDARNGSPNVLLRNDGNWTFADATVESGLDAENRRWSFAAAWEDYDNDGDQDLYVANDFGRNALYRNDDGRFENVADDAGVEDTASGMSAAWGDADRDGIMDLYVGNMYSSAGNRITTQPMFRAGTDVEMRETMRRMAKGNSLFLGSPDGDFEEVAEEVGAAMGRWAWSSIFADLNNDGWEDIVVANGFLTAEEADDL
jgi:hypothetical protein